MACLLGSSGEKQEQDPYPLDEHQGLSLSDSVKIDQLGQFIKMAYLATNPKTNNSYAICSAEPDFIADTAKEIAQWKKDGALIELLPAEEAKVKFCNCLSCSPKQEGLF